LGRVRSEGAETLTDTSSYVVSTDDPRAPDVRALLQRHLDFANEHSPPEDVHALDVDGLAVPEITFLSVREGGVLLGVGAIKELDPGHGELKSMHTLIEARGRGVGRAVLTALLELARTRGYTRVSLETGSMAAFAPARAMYVAAGFVDCGPFADYVESSYSTFMSLALTPH
jgi:putative acetyltransferase